MEKTSHVIKKHHSKWSDEYIEELVLKAIREEEIRIHKFLVHFCKLSLNERKKIWSEIFNILISSIPKIKKKHQKQILRDCQNCMEDCLAAVSESCSDMCEKAEGIRTSSR